jgi:hypothetical protein
MLRKIGYCAIIFLNLSLNGFAEQDGGSPPQDKFYAEPGTVFVSSDAIYVNWDGSFIEVKAVASDENGVYVEGFDAGTNSESRCVICKRWYDPAQEMTRCPHSKL